ncbi:MAG: HYR domain-containing protein, partial [Saprospiraceae bacterium]
MKKLKPFLLVFGFLFALQTAFGHGVQIGYCVLDNGFIRVYIEHWHGDQTVQSLAGNTISVTTTYGSTTVTQNVNAAGAVNNTSWNNLPGCGASITILAQCPGEANNYNDWGYFDFAPAACGVPVSITINAGNTVVFAEACSQLYPQTITNTFNDTAPPVVTCPSNMSVTSCNATTVSYTATAVDACDPNPTVSYDIAPGSTFNLGTTTVTVTATDDQNQSSTCTFDVTVADDIPPTISCPSNIIEDTDPGICEDDPFFVATANDNCSATVTYSHAPGTYFPKGVTTVTATATDPAGNQASCSFTISVSDNEAPAITCPANITSSTDPGACDAVVDYTAPAGTDNCNGVTTARTDGLASGSAFPKGTTTVSYTATDASSNQTSCSFTVTVTDDEDPVITCPSNITVNTDANSCDAVVSYSSPSFADNCSGTTTALTSGLGSGSTFPLGTSTENWTATDAAGNTAICSFTITVEDNEAPNVVGQNITVQLDASGNASITPANVDGGTSDNCSFTLTVDKSSFGAADLGSNTVTLTATDPAGNSSSTTVTVTVEDLIPPTAVSQNITVSLDANGNAVITPADVDGGSYDNTPFTLTLDITSFGCSNTGPNTVTLTATDASSNTNSTTATVTVVDDIAPTAICQNVTVAVDANGDASITTTDVDNGSFDNCSFSLSLDNTSFNCADLGGNTVTLTATDASGNTGSCTATITVEDNILPSVTCKAYTAVLDANGQASITMSDVYDSGSDNCGTVDLVNVTPYSFDCGDVGANTVTLFVNDSHGNFNNCTATVTVADNSIPTVTCKNVTAQLDANGQASIVPADIFDSGDDNCGSANISLVSVSQGSFGCSDLGTQTVTLTVADANGNTATCTATVTVEDNVAPAAQCQDISVVLDVNSQASITVSQVNNGSSDACGTPSLALDVTSFDCDDLGANTVTLTATDASGNASSCTATVTVTVTPVNDPPAAV